MRAKPMRRGWFERQTDRVFDGQAASWVYPMLRIGVAAIFLVRHTDWTRAWLPLQHHRWVKGFDFNWSIASPPYLTSPFVPGVVLSETTNQLLVYARTALALMLLVGLRSRAAALFLALVGYVLIASDRYRYFHHLHLFYVTAAVLSLAPIGARWSLDQLLSTAWLRLRRRRLRALATQPLPQSRPPPPKSLPIWPLQLVRAVAVSVYLASGIRKLDPDWLSGETLASMQRLHLLHGPAWAFVENILGSGGIAKLACITELALPVLLMARMTRYWAIIVAILFHTIISASMSVSTFGVQMAILLMSFIPKHETPRMGDTVRDAVHAVPEEPR